MLYDAHNHFHDERLKPFRARILEQLRKIDFGGAVLNGTKESDWEELEKVCAGDNRLLASVGLHPWFVSSRSEEWKSKFLKTLERCRCGVGEIGLDRWMKDYDWETQQEAFRFQLEAAAERNLPVSIHCLEAWGKLLEILKLGPLPERGFLLHSYAGPVEMIPDFIRLGGYFSLSGYFAHPRKKKQLEVFGKIPMERILLETDAPDMLPPQEVQRYPLDSESTESAPNNPANIQAIYEFFSGHFGMSMESLIAKSEANFLSLFGGLFA
jgi:TatD DNase family protein